MSENTLNAPPNTPLSNPQSNPPNNPSSNPSSPPPQTPPLPPRPRPAAGHSTAGYYTPPYPPQPHNYQQPPPRSGGCARFFIYGLVALVVLGMMGIATLLGGFFLYGVATEGANILAADRQERQLTERIIGGNRRAEDKIAVISISGMIVSNADGFIARQIRQAQADNNVKAIVLRVDSPGGTMAGSDYYLHLLRQLQSKRKIPIVVSMGTTATSGGYFVSMIGDEIFAEPSTLTGSIGVIAGLFNAAELLEKIGVEMTPIVSDRTPHKTMGSFARPMTEEEYALFKRLIDDNLDRFKETIREGRRHFAENPEALDAVATGQIFTANDALANGLIDRIGFLDDAVERAGDLANMAERDYRVIQYRPQRSFMETMLESRAPNQLLTGRTLFDMTTPRIYLLPPQVIPIHEME